MERGHLRVLGITEEARRTKSKTMGIRRERERPVAEIWGNIKSFEFCNRREKSSLAEGLPADPGVA